MSQRTYLRYELLRALRNRRFFVFSLGFPLVLYLVIAGPQRDDTNFAGSGIPTALYYMVGLVAFGTMNAMLGGGMRIAAERVTGWNRQLRLSPLSPLAYFRAKVVTAYVVAGLSIVTLYLAGAALGVRIAAGRWIEMTVLILIGLIPFAALGVVFGHLVTPDSGGPVVGGSVALLALLGGTWFPVDDGVVHVIAECLPSYWLTQASHIGVGGSAWGITGWLVTAAWSAGLIALATIVYRRDTGRV
jgi:ABC-2 type transport system permease protein